MVCKYVKWGLGATPILEGGRELRPYWPLLPLLNLLSPFIQAMLDHIDPLSVCETGLSLSCFVPEIIWATCYKRFHQIYPNMNNLIRFVLFLYSVIADLVIVWLLIFLLCRSIWLHFLSPSSDPIVSFFFIMGAKFSYQIFKEVLPLLRLMR